MGLIRKVASLSTFGGVKYTSRREAETKANIAAARLANTQAKQVQQVAAATQADVITARWEPIVAAIESGEASWDDLPRLQKMSMPVKYIMRCKAAERRRREQLW
jgi:hypothetical protein